MKLNDKQKKIFETAGLDLKKVKIRKIPGHECVNYKGIYRLTTFKVFKVSISHREHHDLNNTLEMIAGYFKREIAKHVKND